MTESQSREYRRSVLFTLIVAVNELCPNAEVVARFTANRGLYVDIDIEGGLTVSRWHEIVAKMRNIVAENRPIEKLSLPREEAVALFKSQRLIAKANLVNSLSRGTVSVYRCGTTCDYFYGSLAASTGALGRFELDYEPPGVLLRTPWGPDGVVPPASEQPKLRHLLTLTKQWASILHCSFIPDLNRHINRGAAGDLVRVSEALHEKRIAEIADEIAGSHGKKQLVLIAGPSSSGKTSFAQRLKVQLRVHGLEPVSLSLDDYFFDRARTPRLADGRYDYESLRALDVPLFNAHLQALLDGKTVSHPTYDFVSGERELDAVPVSVLPGHPILVEGIHGLNPELTASIDDGRKHRIYVSALTALNIDAHNRISTTDTRLLRRLVRDYQFRGSSGEKTLRQWPDVRHGEEANIFPYQENADTMFNTATLYELAALKRYAQPLLENTLTEDDAVNDKLRTLLDLLEYLVPMSKADEANIPCNSIVREFIGGSCFFDADGALR